MPRKFGARLLGCLVGIPIAFLGTMISIPAMLVRKWHFQWNEARFGRRMRSMGRFLTDQEIHKAIADRQNGTLIVEWLGSDGPVRYWWTEEDIATSSPYPCCFDRFPNFWENPPPPFYAWCRSRYMDPLKGSARVVEVAKKSHLEWHALVAELLARHRAVSASAKVEPELDYEPEDD
jgi:hypothetical protein